jgi:phosphonate transport system substrate-binding protein
LLSGRSPLICFALACLAAGLAVGVVAFVFLDRERSKFSPETTLDLNLSGESHEISYRPGIVDSVFRVAIAPVISPEASVELYGELISYIAAGMGLQPAQLYGKNYSEVNDLIRMRQCDMAMVCTYSYVLAESAFGAKLLAAPEIDGKRDYQSLIIVPSASSVTELTELRDRRFASSDVLSTSGWLYPMTFLKRRGIDTANFFAKHIISGSHDRSVFAVKSGVVDAAAVDSLVYEEMLASEPALGKQLKVIHRSPAFGMPPLVVAADLPDDQFAQLQKMLLNMHADPDGRRILKALGFDRFFVPRDRDYDNVRDLHKSWLSAP